MTSIQPALLCHYRYDPLDRLINQAQPDTPVHQRFYCKSRLTTEIQGVMQYSIIQHDDLLLAQRQRQDGAFDATLLATDRQRSVLSTLKANQQRKPITYTPYGHRPASNGLLSLLGFNGERPDPVTGCYLLGNGYRAFNPVLMRFNSPDSLSPFGKGGINSYAYCAGDPVNHVDPTGQIKVSFAKFFKNLFTGRNASPATSASRAARASASATTASQAIPTGRGSVAPPLPDASGNQLARAPSNATTSSLTRSASVQSSNVIERPVQPPPYSASNPSQFALGTHLDGLPMHGEMPPLYASQRGSLTFSRRGSNSSIGMDFFEHRPIGSIISEPTQAHLRAMNEVSERFTEMRASILEGQHLRL